MTKNVKQQKRDWYKNNKTKVAKRRKIINRERLIFLRTYKARKGCADCKETDPLVLDFDHKNPKLKKYNICNMVNSRLSIKSIMKEVKKCEIVCANCHRRRTAKQLKWSV